VIGLREPIPRTEIQKTCGVTTDRVDQLYEWFVRALRGVAPSQGAEPGPISKEMASSGADAALIAHRPSQASAAPRASEATMSAGIAPVSSRSPDSSDPQAYRVKRLQRIPERHPLDRPQTPLDDPLARFLDEARRRGFEVVDHRPKGGALWVHDPDLKLAAEVRKLARQRIFFASAVHRRARTRGWYLRTPPRPAP
jgi:hypothetical protein